MTLKDRMRKNLGVSTSLQYKCTRCHSRSSARSCPDKYCTGTMKLVVQRSQF